MPDVVSIKIPCGEEFEEQPQARRYVGARKIGVFVRAWREANGWSQETLLAVIDSRVAILRNEAERGNLCAITIDELCRLHEGTLARYGLRSVRVPAMARATAVMMANGKCRFY